jgi:outer membrane protein TolC
VENSCGIDLLQNENLNSMKIAFLSTMRNGFCILTLICLSIASNAQTTTTRPVVDTSSAIEEKLVQLALNGPEVEKTAHQNKIDEYQLKNAQNNWMNLLTFNMNVNEFSVSDHNVGNTAYVYPRYNLGLTVPLGTILSRTAVKSAKENIEIGKNNTELIKRSLREQVLTAYKQYVAYGQLIAIQSELANDVKTQLAQAEEKFRSGTVSIDVYNNAQRSNNSENAALIDLRLQQDLKKLEIEKLIGVKLETVLRR